MENKQSHTVNASSSNKTLKAKSQTGFQSRPDMLAQTQSKKKHSFLRVYELADLVRSYNPSVDEDMINRAYVFAMKAHGGQKRHSGDPYFAHPVEVAGLLTELRLDTSSIITGLLHDTVEDTGATLDEIEQLFGQDVRLLVDGVTKLTNLELSSPQTKQAENLQKFFLATAKDVRVLLVKLCDRLHNMRTLHFVPKQSTKERIASETLDIYGPLARRMGIQRIGEELEALAFAVINSAAHKTVKRRVNALEERASGLLPQFILQMKEIFFANQLYPDILWRQKSHYSIWRKLQIKNIDFEQLADLFAFRVILDDVDECYRALGLLHQNWSFVPGYFKDYISTPKPNSYQSIHTCLLVEGGVRLEVQIRTKKMDRIAEYGVAAHWRYKDQSYGLDKEAVESAAGGNPMKFLYEIADLANANADPQEFLDHAKLEMYRDKVFVFSPKGKLVILPMGATALDFAYAIHSELGDQCVGVKINNRHATLRTRLRNSDVVEILRSETPNLPDDILEFVASGRARHAIRRRQRSLEKQDLAVRGEKILRTAMRMDKERFQSKSLRNLIEIYLERSSVDTKEELYIQVGEGQISVDDILATIFPDQPLGIKEERQLILDNELRKFVESTDIDHSAKLSRCRICQPLVEDKIIAVKVDGEIGQSSNNGIGSSLVKNVHGGNHKNYIVHSFGCDELGEKGERTWYPLQWSKRAIECGLLVARFLVRGHDHAGALAMICNAVGEAAANMINISNIDRTENMFEMVFEVEVHDFRHLNNIIAAVRSCICVIDVTRK